MCGQLNVHHISVSKNKIHYILIYIKKKNVMGIEPRLIQAIKPITV